MQCFSVAMESVRQGLHAATQRVQGVKRGTTQRLRTVKRHVGAACATASALVVHYFPLVLLVLLLLWRITSIITTLPADLPLTAYGMIAGGVALLSNLARAPFFAWMSISLAVYTVGAMTVQAVKCFRPTRVDHDPPLPLFCN
jgi:hypothetical protein